VWLTADATVTFPSGLDRVEASALQVEMAAAFGVDLKEAAVVSLSLTHNAGLMCVRIKLVMTASALMVCSCRFVDLAVDLLTGYSQESRTLCDSMMRKWATGEALSVTETVTMTVTVTTKIPAAGATCRFAWHPMM
jgi:hypothetical protein